MRTVTYGPNGTQFSKIGNTAIASWSGYSYQGLCAINHVLDLLLKDWASSVNKKLSIEAYEDFAILDEKLEIESFHQCKCYSSSVNFENECKKMEDKRWYWGTIKKICQSNAGLYFHTNQKVKLSHNVEMYPYKTPGHTCSPSSLLCLISQKITEILKCRRLWGSAETIKCKLISLIINKVEYIHELSIERPGNSFQIACDNYIPIEDFVKILQHTVDEYNLSEKSRICRFFMVVNLQERLLTYTGPNRDRIDNFINVLEKMNDDELTLFVKRIYPDININTIANIIELQSAQRVNFLFNLLTKSSDDLQEPKMHWIYSDSHLTPSTLGCDKEAEEYCYGIVNNPFTNDLRRDYDWVVGAITGKVDDIYIAAREITDIDGKDYTDITQPRKIGLLDIKSKNDGNF